jgi:hypothetical protein
MRVPSPFFLAVLILASCSSPPVQDYAYTPPDNPGGRLCTIQCGQARDDCRQSCGFDERSCVKDMQTQALKDYDEYTRQQFSSGAPIEFRLRDFERTAPCDGKKKRCTNDCESPYSACYTSCGGSVELKNSCSLICF